MDVLKVKYGVRKSRFSKAYPADGNIPRRINDSFSLAYLQRRFEEISTRIRQDRIRRGWTAKTVAATAQISERTIWKYENALLPEERMSIAILRRLGDVLTGNPDAYLTDYHRWVQADAAADVRWLLANHPGRTIADLTAACQASHRSLYLWSRGQGQPNLATWAFIRQLRET